MDSKEAWVAERLRQSFEKRLKEQEEDLPSRELAVFLEAERKRQQARKELLEEISDTLLRQSKVQEQSSK